MAGQWWGGIGGAGWDNDGYDNILDLNGCYFVYVFVKDPGRVRELDARKEAELRSKKRMVTVPLLKFFRNRVVAANIDRGGGRSYWRWLQAYSGSKGE